MWVKVLLMCYSIHTYMYIQPALCSILYYTTGVYEVGVHTWRPSGSRVVDRLKRFFVGGGNELSDISYITKPPDFDVSMHLKPLDMCIYSMFSGMLLE